jgi:hypothetical protein
VDGIWRDVPAEIEMSASVSVASGVLDNGGDANAKAKALAIGQLVVNKGQSGALVPAQRHADRGIRNILKQLAPEIRP